MVKSLMNLGFIFLFVSFTFAQKSVLNSKSIEEYKETRENEIKDSWDHDSMRLKESLPLEYGYINPKDVIWSKVTWEIIDFNDRGNQPYYHTSQGTITQRESLFDALVTGIQSDQIVEIYNDEYFEEMLNKEQIVSRLAKIDTSNYGRQLLQQGEEITEADIDVFETTSDEVKMIKVKGMWYIDRRLGEMRYRLLGLCIMGPDVQAKGTSADDGILADLFWIYFPDARNFLSNYKVFSPSNSSSSVTYDDVLNARRFNSIIYKAETAYGEKPIEDYIPKDAKGQLEEHDRIRATILQAESDMWNY